MQTSDDEEPCWVVSEIFPWSLWSNLRPSCLWQEQECKRHSCGMRTGHVQERISSVTWRTWISSADECTACETSSNAVKVGSNVACPVAVGGEEFGRMTGYWSTANLDLDSVILSNPMESGRLVHWGTVLSLPVNQLLIQSDRRTRPNSELKSRPRSWIVIVLLSSSEKSISSLTTLSSKTSQSTEMSKSPYWCTPCVSSTTPVRKALCSLPHRKNVPPPRLKFRLPLSFLLCIPACPAEQIAESSWGVLMHLLPLDWFIGEWKYDRSGQVSCQDHQLTYGEF